MNNLCNVTTDRARFSFVHLFKPYAYQQGQEEKYQVTVLIPKSDVNTKARIDAAIEAAKQKGISEKWNGVCPPIVATPVYDGDGVRPSDGMEFGPECKGHWVFTASAKADYPPEVVDSQGNPIINQSEVYSGMYGRVNVTFFPYMFGGKKGIGCGLGPVQKLEDGEVLGGSVPIRLPDYRCRGRGRKPFFPLSKGEHYGTFKYRHRNKKQCGYWKSRVISLCTVR